MTGLVLTGVSQHKDPDESQVSNPPAAWLLPQVAQDMEVGDQM